MRNEIMDQQQSDYQGNSVSKIADEDSMSVDGAVTTKTGSSESEILSEQQTWNGSQWIEYYTRKYGALSSEEFRKQAENQLREMYIAKYGSEDVKDSEEDIF